uniref:Uncharacterized protein n=2 Tax=viral metagenome TaxID=1070528 RepID=A0A6M3L1N2_9ZZZZ
MHNNPMIERLTLAQLPAVTARPLGWQVQLSDAENVVVTLCDCGGVLRWRGDSQAISTQTTTSASASFQIGYPIPAAATGIWLSFWEGNLYVGAPNDAGNRWVITCYASGVLRDTFDTWVTLPMNPTDMYKMRRAIGSYAAAVAYGTKILVGSVSWDYFNRIKAGVPGTLFGSLNVIYHPVYG